MIQILVVEDNEKFNRKVCNYLNDNGYYAKGCLNANIAYAEMNKNLYDLIISDIGMPEISGFEFVENIRMVNETIPILFISAKSDIYSKQKAFLLGGDDYMVKPIDFFELLLRVKALLRRARIEERKQIQIGNFKLHVDERIAEIDGEEIYLTQREFNIIYKLLSYPKKIFTRNQLIDEFWGIEEETNLRVVDVYVTKLRDKLAACDGFKIATVRGFGYKVILL